MERRESGPEKAVHSPYRAEAGQIATSESMQGWFGIAADVRADKRHEATPRMMTEFEDRDDTSKPVVPAGRRGRAVPG
jgi:hypothetical protein